MNEITIPKEFYLLGAKWKIKKVKDLNNTGTECHGLTWQDKRLIELDAAIFGDNDLLTHTFVHELVHAILETMGRPDLSQDEQLVDLFAGLIVQAFNSSKRELK